MQLRLKLECRRDGGRRRGEFDQRRAALGTEKGEGRTLTMVTKPGAEVNEGTPFQEAASSRQRRASGSPLVDLLERRQQRVQIPGTVVPELVVAKHEAQPLAHAPLNLADDGIRAPTGGLRLPGAG